MAVAMSYNFQVFFSVFYETSRYLYFTSVDVPT